MRSPGKPSESNIFLVARRFRPSLLLVFLAFLPASVSGDAGLSPGTGTRGVQVTREVPFASETFDEVRSAAPGVPMRAREDRAIHSHRINRNPFASASVMPQAMPEVPAIPVSTSVAAPEVPSAPVLDSSFAGLGNPPHSQGDVIPPDAMGAAGPNHLVSLLNSDFGVFDKNSGVLLQSVGLQSFWASLGTGAGQPADFPFDPKVLYDPVSGRFISITLGGGSAPDSWVMVAVSSSSDPTGAWNKWAIDADRDNDEQLFFNGADFPGLGIDGANLYITANMFDNTDNYQYSKVWVIPKNQLLTGTKSISWTEFRNPPGSGPTMQPAHTFGIPGAEYIIYEGGTNQLRLARIDNVSGTPVWNPPATVAVAPYVAGLLPGAPQAGDNNTIDTSDTRLLNAVYRNGYVWTTHTVGVNGKTEVAWYQIIPPNSVAAQGRIRDTVRWYYYPSITVNRDDIAAVGFSGSSNIEYASAYYTIIRPTSLTTEPVSLLKSGKAAYYKTFSGPDNRWGDFSATVVDPVDDATFWTLQEYAEVPVLDPRTSTFVSQWGTWWGQFHPSDVLAPVGLTASASPAPQVVLNWVDVSGNETGFKVERRRLPGQDYSVIASVNPDITTFTDSATTGLLGGFTYSYRVQAFNATGGSYSGETFTTTAAPPPPPSSGGGGGCLAITPSAPSAPDGSSVLSLLILFLPAAALYGWKWRFRPGKST